MEYLEKILSEDKVYQKDIQDLKIIEEKIKDLSLSEKQNEVIEDYFACFNTAMERKCEVAFKVGKLVGELNKHPLYDLK